ncbi:zinc finger protein 93-like [Eurosta solidaginis]|uniref:zinc finger protein 93-like n=1 Tax=Eurosta solidaginis TaxID=178769 RepID=UPI0035310B9E
MNTDQTVDRFNCGEIFITKNYSLILECKSCIDKFGVYPIFLDHIFDNHIDGWFENSTTTTNLSTTQLSADNSAIPNTTETVERFYCGEIIITRNFCMIIECNGCRGKFGVYPDFLEHIFDKHFDDWTSNSVSFNTPGVHDELHVDNGEQYIIFDTTAVKEDGAVDELITEVLEPTEYEADDIVIETIEVGSQQKAVDGVKAAIKHVRGVRALPLRNRDKERKHKCRICGLGFSQLCNMRSHEQRHNTIKPFTCVKCHKGFYSNTELKTHLRRHNGEKPFICPYCGKGFVTSGLLNMHEKRHTGKKEHKCDKCDKSFFDSYQLRKHTLVHTKERNHSCKLCEAKFTRRNTLRTHMKIHENALGYECIICNMRFNQRPTLLWHIKSKHKVMNNGEDVKDLKVDNNSGDAVVVTAGNVVAATALKTGNVVEEAAGDVVAEAALTARNVVAAVTTGNVVAAAATGNLAAVTTGNLAAVTTGAIVAAGNVLPKVLLTAVDEMTEAGGAPGAGGGTTMVLFSEALGFLCVSVDFCSTVDAIDVLKRKPTCIAMATAALKRFHAGEVYVTENLSVILECKSCDERFGVYAQFLDHILGKHYDDWIASNTQSSKKSTKTNEIDERLVDNEQYLEIERTYVDEYASVDDLITEILQPMELDEIDAMEDRPPSRQFKTVTEVSSNHVRAGRKQSLNAEERKYKCKTCSAAFGVLSHLRLHEQRHTKIKPFTCLKCERAFYTSSELNTHLMRHNGEKPFVCTYCGISFVTITQLTNHERRHTNDRRYKCNECDKRFFDARQLSAHKVVHTKERNYACEECSATFTQKIALYAHRKLHVNALEYKCIVCDERYNQKSSLQLHMKRKHDVLKVKT